MSQKAVTTKLTELGNNVFRTGSGGYLSWQAGKTYNDGDVVIAPDGQLVECIGGTTSTSEYDPGEWAATTVDEQSRKRDAKISNIASSSGHVVCQTGGSTAAKTITVDGITEITNKLRLLVQMNFANTATGTVTLNINNLGAKTLYYNGATVSAINTWETGEIVELYYANGNFQCFNAKGGSGSGGNMILEWNTDAATTRKSVKAKDRKAGMQISYLDPDNGWVNEQYIGTLFTDVEWVKDTNWSSIVSKSQMDLAISDNTMVQVSATYQEEDVVKYNSTDGTTREAHLYGISVAPNIDGGYYVNEVKVWAKSGTSVKLSLYKAERKYPNNPSNLAMIFTKMYDIANTVSVDGVATFSINNLLIEKDYILVASSDGRNISDGTYKDSLYSFYNYSYSIYDVQIGDKIGVDNNIAYQLGASIGRFTISYVLADDVVTEDVQAKILVKKLIDGDYNDDELSEASNNPVKSKAIYKETNIIETEVIPPGEYDYQNGPSTVKGYLATAGSIEIEETESYKLLKVDVRATTGVEVKLGIYSFRRFDNNPDSVNYNRGYFTFKKLLGSQTSVDTHAVFTLDEEINPNEDVVIASTGSQAIGYIQTDNNLKPLYDYANSNIYNLEIGEETSDLYSYGIDVAYQIAYSVKYKTLTEKTITTKTNVKEAVKGLLKSGSGSGNGGWLSGKKWSAAGDSVTHGVDETLGDDGYYHTYVYYIAKRNGLLGTDNLHWDGISGSTMGIPNDPYKEMVAFAKDRYKDIPLDSDYITLWFGINDNTMIIGGKETLGDINSTDTSTFYGAYNVVLTYLITNAPKAKIGLVVSHRAGQCKDAIRALAKKYGLSVFDIEKDARIPFWHRDESYDASMVDETIKTLRTERWWLEQANSVHPLSDGYEYISYPFEDWMRSL